MILIIAILISLLIFIYYYLNNRNRIWDYAKIHYAVPQVICKPHTVQDILDVIKAYPNHQISIAGSKYSHGGQTLLDQSIYLDFAEFNQILSFDASRRLITVQAGTTWETIIHYLDQYDLSVSEMQSYCNFSVGGSVSVNCHGRGLLYGTVGDSVESMTVLTTQDHLFVIDRSHYPDLFAAVIGGYGGIAIIIDVTLIVTNNFPIERKVTTIPINQLDRFYATLKQNKSLVFYNSNIYPKNETEIVNICWYKAKSSQALTCKDRLQTKQEIYLGHMILEQILRRNNASKYLRAQLEPSILTTKAIVYKNYEMSYDVEALEPLMKFPTTNILQEYFVPVKSIRPFLASFRNIINDYGVNLLNISLRYVMATNLPILNYAPTDRIAVVLYLNIGNNSYCVNYAKQWTQLVINAVLKLGGSYYLPYLPLATLQQFRLAYPNYHLYMKIKKKYDPQNRLSNQFIDQYLRH